MRVLIAALAATLLLAACGSLPGASTPSDLPTPGSTATLPADTVPPDLTLPPEMSMPPNLGEFPEPLFRQAAEEAAAAANATLDQVEVVRAEHVTWSDGSLGCPEPGMGYHQALVPGYWLVLRVAGQEFDFRGGERGLLRLCPAGQGVPPIEDR